MLVLSRRVKEALVFPSLGVRLQVLKVSGRSVRLGVEAPPEISVLRQELCSDENCGGQPLTASAESRDTRHRLRNVLNVTKVGIELALRYLETGRISDARCALHRTLDEAMMQQQGADAGPTPRDDHSMAPPAVPAKNAPRALLVDDNPNELALMAGYLRLSGYEVATAKDGLDAMTRLARGEVKPDVVLLDMRMPRLDGPKTVSAIRGNPNYRGVKLIAVSGVSHEEAKVPVGARGVDRWILKPVNPAELVDELNRELTSTAVSA